MEHWWNDTDGGKPSLFDQKSVPVSLLFTTNPTWTDTKWDLGLSSEMSENVRRSHSTALED
jgi:hypothetical protein